MKGCPLKCMWCSNPESQKTEEEVIHRNSLCIQCGSCKEVCETDSITVTDEGVQINRDTCITCGKCAEACYTGTLSMVGSLVTVDDIMDVVKKDSLFYRNSGGGITVGGGEPLVQAEFVRDLLEACHKNGWHTVLDTCGYGSAKKLKMLLEHADLVFYDLKHMDSRKHKKITGVPNGKILKNAELISSLDIPMYVRIPMIPGLNDDKTNIRKTAKFAKKLKNVKQVNLLPYHLGGLGKHNNLDREYPMGDLKAMKDDDVAEAKGIFEKEGFKVEVGG